MKGNITIRGILICGFCLLFLSHASACDMMGVSFNKNVDLNNLFSRFRTISDHWSMHPRLFGDLISQNVF